MTEQETVVARRILQQFQKCTDLDQEAMDKIERKLTEMEEAFHPHPDPLPVVMDPMEEQVEYEPLTEQPVDTTIENTDDSQGVQDETLVDSPPINPPSPPASQGPAVIEESGIFRILQPRDRRGQSSKKKKASQFCGQF